MERRLAYALAGGLLSAGAPAGLLGVRLSRRPRGLYSVSPSEACREMSNDRASFVYVGISTAVAFTLFGYVLGRQADRLVRLSRTDALTGLANARALFENLERELARSRRYREPLALLFVDLDDLKGINDRYGHPVGDAAIRRLASVIRSELRRTDLGARWGGDEFAVLAPNTGLRAARALAERIRALIPESDAEEFPVTASVGVAVIVPAADGTVVDSATLIRDADAALYEAKKSGRNKVVAAVPTATSR